LAIADGMTTVQAAELAGVSEPVGVRWFRDGGGMPTVTLAPLSGRYLSFEEREEIALLRAQGAGIRQIARQLGRAPSTISRELRRNAATRGGMLEYRASVAQWKAELMARRPKTAKLATNDTLREYVQERLSGRVRRPDGTAVPGPATRPWNGRNRPRRQDRRWGKCWSPGQISNRLRLDFPDDDSMRISHEAIYQALYVQSRGALKRELVACLRTGRALRVPRARTQRGKNFVTDEIMISERPAEAEDRAVPGHWEGDLILGTGHSAIGTLVERSTRFTMLLHLPPPENRQPRVHNGPPVTGHGGEHVRDAIAAAITTLPDQLRRSLTWDQGAEMAEHAKLRIQTGLQVYFCDPQSPWQRGTNENTNGLLRQYFPRGTDLARHSTEDLAAVAAALNSRPRKTLGWRTPAEVLNDHLAGAA
jgi:IS30 family transposase